MPRAKKSSKKPIEQYDHKGNERLNNPPVGLVTPETDQEAGKRTYAYDPHLDPQLEWAGKAEHTSFEVPTVSLHVHERIDPRTIIEAVRKRNGQMPDQMSLFASPVENPPLREAIEFYKHKHNWSNRLIAGDSLLVINSLLEKEGMAGQVQMVYLDPPYGIKYGSNFQPFVNKRDVKDGKDEDLTQEPETLKAFRDTWELGIHSYLTFLRDRLLLARELLSESGSIFVQISDDNVHHVRELMDEIFGSDNFIVEITFKKTGGQSSSLIPSVCDILVFYAKSKALVKYHRIFVEKIPGQEGATNYTWIEELDGTRRSLTTEEKATWRLPVGARIFQPYPLFSEGPSASDKPFTWEGETYLPASSSHWKTTTEGLERLAKLNRLIAQGRTLRFVNYLNDYPVTPITNVWTDTQISGFASDRVYVVQTLPLVIQRCMLMTTDPGDLVFDPTCGSGTTAYVAEQWGRRWITCDTSRVSITLAKQRLMTALYDYYELAHPAEGIGSGFKYKTVVNIRLTHGKKSAAEHHVITALGLIGQDVRVTLDTRSAPIGQANTTLVRFGGLPVEPSGTGFEVGQATW